MKSTYFVAPLEGQGIKTTIPSCIILRTIVEFNLFLKPIFTVFVFILVLQTNNNNEKINSQTLQLDGNNYHSQNN
jgi:hypothetical protein